MAEYLPKLETTLMFGVGAAFDFHAGRVSQAPRWMQRSRGWNGSTGSVTSRAASRGAISSTIPSSSGAFSASCLGKG